QDCIQCGKTKDYCETGCQSAFGSCTGSSSPSVPLPLPEAPIKVSTDATCGGTKGYTCVGSGFGDCCSEWGYCGITNAYCGNGCQSKFGRCRDGQSSSSSSSVSSTISSTTSSS